MRQLLAAIDETNDGEYLGFVVGDRESVDFNIKQLPANFSRMAFLSSRYEKRLLLSKFKFDGNIRVCCVNFGLNEIKSTAKSTLASVNKLNMSSRKINKKIAYEIVFDIKRLYADFLAANKSSVGDIEFEVDKREIMGFLRDGGLRYRTATNIHLIADCIAHVNPRNFKLDDKIVELQEEFRNEFHDRVARSLSRK
ncbi:MAG: hypothetical protein WBF33_21520 [Candidatus Nitrosopolaris sp.]|jgi:hypothetical protein